MKRWYGHLCLKWYLLRALLRLTFKLLASSFKRSETQSLPLGRLRPGPPTSPSAAGGSFLQIPRLRSSSELSQPPPRAGQGRGGSGAGRRVGTKVSLRHEPLRCGVFRAVSASQLRHPKNLTVKTCAFHRESLDAPGHLLNDFYQVPSSSIKFYQVLSSSIKSSLFYRMKTLLSPLPLWLAIASLVSPLTAQSVSELEWRIQVASAIGKVGNGPGAV